MQAINKLSQEQGFAIIGSWPARKPWAESAQFIKLLNQAKLIIVNGEGTLHHDTAASMNILKICCAAKSLAIPVAIVNATIEDLSDKSYETLSQMDFFSVRDVASASSLAKKDISSIVSPDLSIFYAASYSGARKIRKSIGFSDSVIPQKSLELYDCCRRLNGKLVSIHHKSPFLAGFIREAISIREDLKDANYVLRIAKHRFHLWVNSGQNTGQFFDMLSSLELLVSGRFHACTIAMTVQTPFLAISSNTSKISSLIHDAGLQAWRQCDNLASISGLKPSDFRWSSDELNNINEYKNHAINSAKKLFSELRALVDG